MPRARTLPTSRRANLTLGAQVSARPPWRDQYRDGRRGDAGAVSAGMATRLSTIVVGALKAQNAVLVRHRWSCHEHTRHSAATAILRMAVSDWIEREPKPDLSIALTAARMDDDDDDDIYAPVVILDGVLVRHRWTLP